MAIRGLKNKRQRIPWNNYQFITTHPGTEQFSLLHGQNAACFLSDMGKIDLPDFPFTSGYELTDFLQREADRNALEWLFPHKAVIVLISWKRSSLTVLVSAKADYLAMAIIMLGMRINSETQEVLDNLLKEREEELAPHIFQEKLIEAFKLWTEELINQFFSGAPPADGSKEVGEKLMCIQDNAYLHLRKLIRRLSLRPSQATKLRNYAYRQTLEAMFRDRPVRPNATQA